MPRRFRRARHLVCYWEETRGVIYNYATAMQATVSSPTWRLVDFCAEWKSRAEIARALMPAVPATVVDRLLDALVRATFLDGSHRPADAPQRRMDRWRGWNPSAGFFHSASRQVTYSEPAPFEEALRRKARSDPMPPSVKPAAVKREPLPEPEAGDPLARIAASRRTWRQFARRPVTRAELAQLLWLTSGITHWLKVPGLGDVPLTTSPSGGARHPIETYVVVLGVRGLTRGLYRYAPDRHELDLVRSGASRAQLRQFIPQQPWVGHCGAALFFAAVFERTQWRYDFARAYRAVILEAGHMCQTFLLAATSLGLAPFCTIATDDRRVEAAFRLDGIDEAVLYAAAVGTRPALDDRVVMPADCPRPRVRPHVRRGRAS